MKVPGSVFKGVKTMQNAVAATGNGTAIETMDPSDGAFAVLTLQVSGTFVGTVTLEATIDDTNWVAILAENLTDGSSASTATTTGLYRANIFGLKQVRARVSAYTSGNVTVKGLLVA